MMDSKDKRAKIFQYVAREMMKIGVNLPSDLERSGEMVETQWKNMVQRAKSSTDNSKTTGEASKKPLFFDDLYDILKDNTTFKPVTVIGSINGQQKPASESKDIEDEVEELLDISNSLSTSAGVSKIVKVSLRKPHGSKAIQKMVNVMDSVFKISKQTEKRQREMADEKKYRKE